MAWRAPPSILMQAIANAREGYTANFCAGKRSCGSEQFSNTTWEPLTYRWGILKRPSSATLPSILGKTPFPFRCFAKDKIARLQKGKQPRRFSIRWSPGKFLQRGILYHGRFGTSGADRYQGGFRGRIARFCWLMGAVSCSLRASSEPTARSIWKSLRRNKERLLEKVRRGDNRFGFSLT